MTSSIKFIGLVVLMLLIGCKSDTNEKEVITILNSEAFQKRISEQEDLQLVDVRTEEEMAEGRIPGAVLVCYTCDDFETAIQEMDKSRPIYVYCARGRRSANASAVMKKLGFTRVYDLKGGYTAWEEAGMETELP